MSNQATATPSVKLRISRYIRGEADGSEIVTAEKDYGGYSPEVGRQIASLPPSGGTITLTSRKALLDLAEWADSYSYAAADDGNQSGARALAGLAEKAALAARAWGETT